MSFLKRRQVGIQVKVVEHIGLCGGIVSGFGNEMGIWPIINHSTSLALPELVSKIHDLHRAQLRLDNV